jgi:NADPH:quinone reductase
MKAIVIERFGGPESLVIKDIPPPEPEIGWVSIKVFAFGINHAETHMRKGEWAESMPVSGIECVGVVSACPGKEFELDTPVAALMGGLGRTINGSYAEYTRVRATNVVALGPTATTVPWAQLAAIPESYATAWTCLFRNLEITSGQRLLIRGATSALGQAALNLAVHAGAKVTATTRNAERFDNLKAHGATSVELEKPGLAQRLTDEGHEKFDAVLELIGNSTVLESLTIVRRGGRLCLAGFVGGLDPIADFNPLLQMASGVHFSFFGSFVFGTPGFPLGDVPMREVVKMVAENKFDAKPSRVFKFNEIQEAHRVMESNQANGKLVVVVVE